jgi:Holliday junction resolvase RusA-like endonuclease
MDNILTSIQDCLKRAGIIKDDRWQCMSEPPRLFQPIIDRDNPRVEVLIVDDGDSD